MNAVKFTECDASQIKYMALALSSISRWYSIEWGCSSCVRASLTCLLGVREHVRTHWRFIAHVLETLRDLFEIQKDIMIVSERQCVGQRRQRSWLPPLLCTDNDNGFHLRVFLECRQRRRGRQRKGEEGHDDGLVVVVGERQTFAKALK